MEIKAAIFDLDGTLIDSNGVWEKLDKIILDEYSIAYKDELLSEFASLTYESVYTRMYEMGVSLSFEEFLAKINKLAVIEYSENISLKDGAYNYLHKLKSEGTKIALATASPKMLYEPVLRKNNVYELFDAFVTTEDVGVSKKKPDIYLKAAELLGEKPCDCTVFEDISDGIISAKRVGMKCVGVYDSYSGKDREKVIESSDKYILNFNEML